MEDEGTSSPTCSIIVPAFNEEAGLAVVLRKLLASIDGDYEVIVVDDGSTDDTYPPETIPRMVEALSGPYDLVFTTRSRDNIPTFNRLAAGLFSWTARTVYGFGPPDAFSGLCGVRREHLQRMHLEATGFAIEIEVAMKAGRMKLRMLDIPIAYGERIGRSKLNGPRAGLAIALHLLRYLTWRPSPGK